MNLLNILSVVLSWFAKIDNTHPLWHLYWFFAIAIPFFFTNTIPNWLGWGTDQPNIAGWCLIAAAILYVVLFITYLVMQANYSNAYNQSLRVANKLNKIENKAQDKKAQTRK